MSLDVHKVTRPGIRNQQSTNNTDPMANVLEEFSGMVEGELARTQALKGFIDVRSVTGTATLTNYAVGGTELQAIVPGITPDGAEADFSKIAVTIDTVVLARNVLPLLDVFQQVFNARQEIAQQQGKKFSKFIDQAFFIQAAKAAMLTTSPYTSADHQGGSTVTLDSGASATDPAVIYAAIANLMAQMEEKDVDPQADDLILALRPEVFYAMLQAEQIVNSQYVTANDTKVDGWVFKAFGVPVIRSNNIPNTNVTGHMLSNDRNGNAYDGDFSNLVGLAFSPRALLAGETIPLKSEVFWDPVSKNHFVDSYTSFAVTPNRPEFAGAILLP